MSHKFLDFYEQQTIIALQSGQLAKVWQKPLLPDYPQLSFIAQLNCSK